jgi:hypothetical protein
MQSWAALLEEGDFSDALASCLQEFSSRPDSLEASWAIAEIEERWGDSLLLAGELDAAGHFRAARMALIPPRAQFTSIEENNRRMEAHSRVADKLSAIDPTGKLRPGQDVRPHPNFTPRGQTDKTASQQAELPIEKTGTELGDTACAASAEYARLFEDAPGARFTSAEEDSRRVGAQSSVADQHYAIDPGGKPRPGQGIHPHPNFTPPGQPDKPASPQAGLPIENPRMELEDTAVAVPAQYAQLYQGSDHWRQYDLGVEWREAGKALAQLHPGAARRAYAWSLLFFDRYRRAWREHLPSSRWDPDGASEIAEIQNLTETVAAGPSEQPLPAWVDALFSGDWQRALAALGGAPPESEWAVLSDLLAGACQAAAQPDDARRPKESRPEGSKKPA